MVKFYMSFLYLKGNAKKTYRKVFAPTKTLLIYSLFTIMQGCWNWQTSRPQTPVFLTCGFKSRPLHQKILQKRIHFLQYFFIQVADLVYHHRTKCGGYHQPFGLYIITHQRVSFFDLMIYKTSF